MTQSTGPSPSAPDSRPSAHPVGLAAGWLGRNIDVTVMSLLMLIGFGLLIAGLEIVRVSPDWGFTYEGAVDGVLSQLAVTGPAAVLMTVATAANVLAGAVALRWLGAPAFRRLSDVVLAGFAAAVVLDCVTLFLLGSVGLFGWPELLALHVAVGAAYLATRRRRPLMAVPIRLRVSRPAAWWLPLLAVWAYPIIVALASPTVPFMDVLPNHVAPVEHARAFGSFATLTTSPSPIYGPSRLMLGYVSLLGTLTTITNLHAALAEAAFAVPLTLLMAIAMRRLAGELFGGSAGFWVLLTFPLTFTFMRLPDSRGTVAAFPLAAWALCVIAAEVRARGKRRAASTETAAPSGAAPWQMPDLGLAFALGATFLVHPLVGLITAAAACGALALYPARLARRLAPALAAGCLVAGPQVLTMGGISTQAWVGALYIFAGIAVAFALPTIVGATADLIERLASAAASRLPDAVDRARTWLPIALDLGRAAIVAAAIFYLLSWSNSVLRPSTDPLEPAFPSDELMTYFPHLVWLSLGGAILAALRLWRGWVVLGCAVVAGLAAWGTSGLIGYESLTDQAVHYEVPKTVQYWLPVMLAVGAAGALAAVQGQRWARLLRPMAIGYVVFVAMYPGTMPLTKDVQIGEHRGSESLGLALREAEIGYWGTQHYPDSRLIIDAAGQEVVDELRSEEAAGRLGPDTRVLHIAFDFQQWDSIPIGVFTGAMETSISLYPELSKHTVGGRLLGLGDLDQELASDYGYVVLEPDPRPPPEPDRPPELRLPGDLADKITAAGYHEIWSNSRAIIYIRS